MQSNHDFFKPLNNIKIPVEYGPERTKKLAEEKELRFIYIFHEELLALQQLKNSQEMLLNTLFFGNENTREKNTQLAWFKIFLTAVRHGYIQLADHILNQYPEFLMKPGTVLNKLNNMQPLENINALECACYEGDVQMIEMLLTHNKNSNEAFKILDKYYPDSYDAKEAEPQEDTFFDFTNIVSIIDTHKDILEKYDVNVYIQQKNNILNEEDIDNYTDGELKKLKAATKEEIKLFDQISAAINNFKALFLEYETAQQKNMALPNVAKALDIFINQFDSCNLRQRILFFSNIFGFIESRLSVNDTFVFCQGLYHVSDNCLSLNRQSLLIRDFTKKRSVDIPFFSSSMGESFGVYSGSSSGPLASTRWGAWARDSGSLINYLLQKHLAVMKLKRNCKLLASNSCTL